MDDLDPEPGRGGRLLGIFLPVFLLVIGLPVVAELYIDQRWFKSIGYPEIFATTVTTQVGLALAAGLCTGLLLLANLRLAVRLSVGLTPLVLHDPDGVPRVNLGQVGARLSLPACVVIAVLTGLFCDRYASMLLLFLHGGEIGVTDPIFKRDVGFYLFRLPLYDVASSFTLLLLLGCLVATTTLYTLRGALTLHGNRPRVPLRARAHLYILLALLLLTLALRSYLDMFDVLYSRLGPVSGASYADLHARLPALRIQVATASIGAALVLASIRRESSSLVVLAGGLYLAARLGSQIYPSAVHEFSVRPNELERESPYLKYNIEATRAAYALDSVVERELSARGALTAQDIRNNRDTIDNIRLWDHQPLLDAFAQIQEIRTYYDFASVDNDRYLLSGKLRQIMLSARELNTDSLPNPTWINKRFTFTHGYGLTLGPVNETTSEGLPVLLVQDIPPRSMSPDIRVSRPALYFGELSSDHVFVRTRNHEFDYPSSEGNAQTDYRGKDGIRFDSALMRFLLAVKLGSLDLILSHDIDSSSRVLLYRNIRDRLARIAPFVTFDPDPYLVVRRNGTLVWICDGYTTSDRYPYAEPVHGRSLNYIRNSVKAVIDAYDGTVTFYVADEVDPILRAFRRIFPHSFTKLSQMPPDIRAHLRYPEQVFEIQTEMFSVYHMREAELLYNREDQWEVPSITAGDDKGKMEPYYTVMKLPGENHAEFILMLPFTPKRKDNLAAWMVARSDGDSLGQLVVYRFPKDRLVFGPQQLVNRINQDAEISRQISLWDQHGSQAVFGTLLVIPVEESLIYVRPLYLRSEGGKIPELKRVIVAYEKQIAMKSSLREAIDAIFGAQREPAFETIETDRSPKTGPSPTRAVSDQAANGEHGQPLASEALRHFEQALGAQRQGDWARYGVELEAVEHVLRQMAPGTATPPERSSARPNSHPDGL